VRLGLVPIKHPSPCPSPTRGEGTLKQLPNSRDGSEQRRSLVQMTTDTPQTTPVQPQDHALHHLARKNVLAGLMFIAIAALGLWVSRDYPIGTALRMGTGYVPRFLCWILLGLGAAIVVQGLREKGVPPERTSWRQLMPIMVVTTSLVAFALALEQLGLVLSILLLIGIGAIAARDIKIWETLIAAVVLIALSWAIFILGLGLTIPVWPVW
jgi:putative tricarboxylic transport membrane protein